MSAVAPSTVAPDLGELLRESAARHLGDEAAHLLALRQLDEPLLPIGQHNVAILAELAGFPDPDQAGYDYAVPYLVLLTHCDLLDAAVDGEATSTAELLGIAGTLAWFWSIVEDEIVPGVSGPTQSAMRATIRSRLSERSAALRIETVRRRTWEPPDEIDASVAAGRSACIVLFYEILCRICGQEPKPAIVTILADYLHAFQLGDDLGDWEADLAAGNHTPLLRGCAARLGRRATYGRDELERELFLGGFYERYTGQLVRTVDGIIERLDDIGDVQTGRLREYVAGKRADAVYLLTEVVRSKLDFLAARPAAGETGLRVRRARLTRSLFRRLVRAASRQSEYRERFGGVWWWLLWRLQDVVYVWYRRGRAETEVLVVECGDAVVGAMGLMPTGEISTAIVVGSPGERRAAMRLLWRAFDDVLRQSDQRHWVMTDAAFRSLIATLDRRGFEEIDLDWSIATLPLGPLTWSWATKRRRIPGIRFTPQVRLVRPAPGSGSGR